MAYEQHHPTPIQELDVLEEYMKYYIDVLCFNRDKRLLIGLEKHYYQRGYGKLIFQAKFITFEQFKQNYQW